MFFFVYPESKILFYILIIGWLVAWFFIFKTIAKKLYFLVGISYLLLYIWLLINNTQVQNFLIQKITPVLSENLKADISIKHVDFSLFNKMLIEGILLKDKQRDTLLYAGVAKVNITDWFFLKDTPNLKYIAISNVVVNLQRTDSVWNYQFLADYFYSPKKTKSKNNQQINFNLKTIDLQNIRFNVFDKWIGQDLNILFSKLLINADSINLDKNIFAISSIDLNNPSFFQNDYTGNRQKSNIPLKKRIKTISQNQYQWNNDDLKLFVKNIHITNGSFKNEKETSRLPYTNQFDGLHFLFSSINGDIKNISFLKDTLLANIDIMGKEKCGFEIKKLQSFVKFTPNIMEFNNLDLQTPKSKLGNYYAMRYNDFNKDMSDFIHSVNLEGKFEKTIINSDDIAYFAQDLKTWKRQFSLSGFAKGTIDNLQAKKMLVSTGNTTIDGDITLRGLPDISNTFIDFKSNLLKTNYYDLVTFVPQLKNLSQIKLNKLGNINFTGSYTGFINDFVTYGNLNTQLGNIVADINMKIPDNKTATYSGKISTAGFKLGEFIENNNLGSISLDGKIIGSGFTIKDLNANFKGDIHQFQFSNYNYNNISVDGNFNNNLFTGHGNLNDRNLKIDNFDGSVSLLKKDPVYKFEAILKKANLKNLHFANEDFALDGHFILNFTGNNIDNFLGNARVYDATLRHDSVKLSFDSLALQSFIKDHKKYLFFQSNELAGNVTGNFKILELPNAFQVFLSKYYPAYIKTPTKKLNNQDFNFFVKTKNIDDYIRLFDKKLKGFNNANIDGSLKLATNELEVNANIPSFEYDKKIFNDVALQSRGNSDTLDTKITAGDITLNDSLSFPQTNLSIKSSNDLSEIHLITSASKTLNEAELNAQVKTLNDGVKIHFYPSSFMVNDKKWKLEKDGELTLRKSYIDASEIKFVQGNQEIIFSTEMAENGTNGSNIVAKLNKVNINDFTPLFIKQPRLEGVLTGVITVEDPFGKTIVNYDATAADFKLDNTILGNTSLNGSINTFTGVIKSNAKTENDQNKFNLTGTYNFKDTANSELVVNFLSERFNIDILNNYLGNIFSNMQGNAISDLKMRIGKNYKYITGKVLVSDGSLKVNYTQCKYKFTNQTILFNPDEINLGGLHLKDSLNNEGIVSGKIHHQFFDNFSFEDVRFTTTKMLLLNTNEKDNSSFYGKVIGNAVMTLDGPITNTKMKINGEPSTLDSSHIYLPTGAGKETGIIDYIDFVQFGNKMEDVQSKQGANITVDMDLIANPSCKIDVILDKTTGDIIKGQGNGILNIKVGTTEPITIRGRYDITKGDYTFNFETFLKKYFTISKGSIVWNGDPLLANINIEAEYLAKNVDVSSLSSSNNFKQKGDLNIVANLTGVLNKPDIGFTFVLAEQNPLFGDYIAQKHLEDYKNNKNEMLKQVASLLLINSFINNNSKENTLTQYTPFSIAANTIGGVVSGWLTGIFNKSLEKATNGVVSTYLDISGLDLQASAALLQANVKTGLQFLLNNRLVILLGGNIDINSSAYSQLTNKSLITPDITIEYKLTKDGRWRAIGFNRTSFVASDVTGLQRNKTGVKISYRKEFDKLTKEQKAVKKEKRKPYSSSGAKQQ